MTTRQRFDLDRFIDNLPEGLDRALLRILSFHQGRDAAIGRRDLVDDLATVGYKVSERAARAQISQLRKAGHVIGSAPGEDGGYYLCRTVDEFEDFVRQEYLAKISDMQESLAAMRKGAARLWGDAAQPKLF